MSDAPSFVEIEGQHVELLPARTTLIIGGPLNNLLGNAGGDGGGAGSSGDAIAQNGSAQNVQKPVGGDGGGAQGGGVLGGLLGTL
ncbi:MAG: hypothetical protein ACRDTG_23905 [Pseudonocardiaceae bacterium]